jgi:hypothetical protein
MSILAMEICGNNLSQTRRELSEIENKLHPIITIDGKAIVHRHVGSKIVFSAYIGTTPFNNREFSILRDTVLSTGNFYKKYHNELCWLVEIGPIQEKLEKE